MPLPPAPQASSVPDAGEFLSRPGGPDASGELGFALPPPVTPPTLPFCSAAPQSFASACCRAFANGSLLSLSPEAPGVSLLLSLPVPVPEAALSGCVALPGSSFGIGSTWSFFSTTVLDAADDGKMEDSVVIPVLEAALPAPAASPTRDLAPSITFVIATSTVLIISPEILGASTLSPGRPVAPPSSTTSFLTAVGASVVSSFSFCPASGRAPRTEAETEVEPAALSTSLTAWAGAAALSAGGLLLSEAP
mmetsp:Transcript_20501/g.30090  ORF Transcript_20501/g.30090 Transcript_20501/m.30090 type:complete len:250 (-) Transcript_20501:365-1114(-)